jgi:hypothetical protein
MWVVAIIGRSSFGWRVVSYRRRLEASGREVMRRNGPYEASGEWRVEDGRSC